MNMKCKVNEFNWIFWLNNVTNTKVHTIFLFPILREKVLSALHSYLNFIFYIQKNVLLNQQKFDWPNKIFLYKYGSMEILFNYGSMEILLELKKKINNIFFG